MKIKNYSRGQAVITAVVLFLFFSTLMILGAVNPILRRVEISNDLFRSRESLFLAEASVEDIAYRIVAAKPFSGSESLTLNGNTVTTSVTAGGSGYTILASAKSGQLVRKNQAVAVQSGGTGMNYGAQVGAGGLTMQNQSSISGNVYSNGPITSSSNIVTGTAVSAGASGSITNTRITSDAYAHSIVSSNIGGSAYFQTISDSSVTGTQYPGSADQSPQTLPISDSEIEQLKTSAAAGGTWGGTCPWKPSPGTHIGPRKVNCDLQLFGNGTFYIDGNIWVNGNISITSGSTRLRVNPALGAKSVALIAHNVSNTSSGSTISIQNAPIFQNSGTAGSYVVLISQNNSKETGGANAAITVSNNISGDVILYAGHGAINILQGTGIRGVSGYSLLLQNSATITYQTGLASLLFQGGPSASYSLQIQSWKEVQ